MPRTCAWKRRASCCNSPAARSSRFPGAWAMRTRPHSGASSIGWWACRPGITAAALPPAKPRRPDAMELRHLRFFVAVAEEGSLTTAAEKRLHTAQPSLSRQIRDLEYEVGAQLLTRSAKGVELTPAGRAFLDHARLALAQVEVAGVAAPRASHPAKA